MMKGNNTMTTQASHDPRDYILIPKGDGWIVESASGNWYLSDGGRGYCWFDDKAEAQWVADYANDHYTNTEKLKKVIGRTVSRMFRGGR